MRLFVDMDGTLAESRQNIEIRDFYREGYFKNLLPCGDGNVMEAVRELLQRGRMIRIDGSGENKKSEERGVQKCDGRDRERQESSKSGTENGESSEVEIEVYTLSAVFPDSEYSVPDKNAWLDRYMPELDDAHRIFMPVGEDKRLYVPGGLQANDVLLDDYTRNLNQWCQEPEGVKSLWHPGTDERKEGRKDVSKVLNGVKLLNGINSTHGTWRGKKVSAFSEPHRLAEEILQAAGL